MVYIRLIRCWLLSDFPFCNLIIKLKKIKNLNTKIRMYLISPNSYLPGWHILSWMVNREWWIVIDTQRRQTVYSSKCSLYQHRHSSQQQWSMANNAFGVSNNLVEWSHCTRTASVNEVLLGPFKLEMVK